MLPEFITDLHSPPTIFMLRNWSLIERLLLLAHGVPESCAAVSLCKVSETTFGPAPRCHQLE